MMSASRGKDAGQRLDGRSRPEYVAFLDHIALIGCRHALLERTMAPRILRTHKMPAIGHPQGPYHFASPRRIAFVPDANESLHNILCVVHVQLPFQAARWRASSAS
jgi:hypothetical protein